MENKLLYKIYCNNELLVTSNNCNLTYMSEDFESGYHLILIEFQDFTLPKTIKIKKNDDLDINLTFETNILFSFPARLQNDLLFHNSNIFSIIVESCADIDFCALAFFKTWLKGDTTLHWENMSSTMLKRSWLLACLQWSVLFPPQKKPIK